MITSVCVCCYPLNAEITREKGEILMSRGDGYSISKREREEDIMGKERERGGYKLGEREREQEADRGIKRAVTRRTICLQR